MMHYVAFLFAATVLVLATGGSQGLFLKSYDAMRAGDLQGAVVHFSTALQRTVQDNDPSLAGRSSVLTAGSPLVGEPADRR